MKRTDITIGFHDASLQERIMHLLRQNSYQVSELFMQGTALLRHLMSRSPGILLTDFEFFGTTDIEILRVITEDDICPVVIVVTEEERELLGPDLEYNESIHLIQKPINRAAFISSLDFIIKNIEKIDTLEREITDLKKVLETRKTVDRAKALIIKKYGLSEDEAHKFIQKKSMETRIPMRKIAEEMINES